MKFTIILVLSIFCTDVFCNEPLTKTIKLKSVLEIGVKQQIEFRCTEISKRRFVDRYNVLLVDQENRIEYIIDYSIEVLELDENNNCTKSKVIFSKAKKKSGTKIVDLPFLIGVPYIAEVVNNKVELTCQSEKAENHIVSLLRLCPENFKEIEWKDVPLGVSLTKNVPVELELKDQEDETRLFDFKLTSSTSAYKFDKIEKIENEVSDLDVQLSIENKYSYKMKDEYLKKNLYKMSDYEKSFFKTLYIDSDLFSIRRSVIKVFRKNSTFGYIEIFKASGNSEESFFRETDIKLKD